MQSAADCGDLIDFPVTHSRRASLDLVDSCIFKGKCDCQFLIERKRNAWCLLSISER
jgi:hypothetical protein